MSKKAKLISTDLFHLDEKSIKKLIHKYDVIFHLAANTQVQSNLKIENESLKKITNDLKAKVLEIEIRIASLEK